LGDVGGLEGVGEIGGDGWKGERRGGKSVGSGYDTVVFGRSMLGYNTTHCYLYFRYRWAMMYFQMVDFNRDIVVRH
jgi:hypothetical protein